MVGINKQKLFVKIKLKKSSLTSGIFLCLLLVVEYNWKTFCGIPIKFWGEKNTSFWYYIYAYN